MKSEIKQQIISFVCHLDDPKADPEHKARVRSWIDREGNPTPEGIWLASALNDQSGTRSTFRNV